MDEKLVKAFNEQINKEFFSAYLYLSMSAYFERMNLQGFKNWMYIQAQEENEHAMGLFKYLNVRCVKVELLALEKPENEWSSITHVFEEALKHEQYISARINELADLADEVHDKATVSFLDWYIKEQVEEEHNVNNILKTLRLICDNANCIYLFDKELQERKFKKQNIE